MNTQTQSTNSIKYRCSYDLEYDPISNYTAIYDTPYDTGFVFLDEEDEELEELEDEEESDSLIYYATYSSPSCRSAMKIRNTSDRHH